MMLCGVLPPLDWSLVELFGDTWLKNKKSIVGLIMKHRPLLHAALRIVSVFDSMYPQSFMSNPYILGLTNY